MATENRTTNESATNCVAKTEKPPLNNDKMARVRHVFGDSVMMDDQDDSFFMYTPSPAKPSDFGYGQDKNDNGVQDNQRVTAISASTTSGPVKVEANSSVTQNTFSAHTDEKENAGGMNIQLDSSSCGISNNDNKKTTPCPTLGYSQRSGMNRQSRSSASSEMIQKTQEAIKKATLSVNKSIGAPVKPKLLRPPLDKSTTRLRDEWQQDLREAKVFYQEMHKKRVEGLELRRQLSSKASREKAAFHQMQRDTKLHCIEEETKFKSSVHREHQKSLRDGEERRRRDSEEVRTKLRANAREGKDRLRMEEIERKEAISDERRAASEAHRRTQREKTEHRRESFQFRSGDARRIRDICSKQRSEQLEQEQTSYELEREGARDVDKYRKDLEKERRESLANRGVHFRVTKEEVKKRIAEKRAKEAESHELERAAAKDVADARRQAEKEQWENLAKCNAEALNIRRQELTKEAEAMEERHKSYELKRASEKDVDDSRKKLQQRRKDSLVYRGKESMRYRHVISIAEKDAKKAEHESYELKRNAEKDVEKYLLQQEQERRNSLANRNQESSRHARVMQELELLAREKETESYALKWAGDNDVTEYQKKQQQERKESLETRGKEQMRVRQQGEEERRQQIQQDHEDEVMRADDHKDVEEYHRKCAERDRTSLEYRSKDARKQRLQNEEADRQEKKVAAANFELKTLAQRDVEEYIKVCKERRRYSLAFRAKEKRRHIRWKEQQEKRGILNQSQIIRGRLMDQRYKELAEQQELAARTMETIQHQHRLYGNKTKNPFKELLD